MLPILIVEDDALLRQTVQWMIDDQGWPVVVARDGQQALDCMRRQRPSLVVLDWGLPDMTGAMVATNLRSIHGESVPIVLMTADGRAAEKARLAGAFAYVHKPFDMDELIEHIRTGLEFR